MCEMNAYASFVVRFRELVQDLRCTIQYKSTIRFAAREELDGSEGRKIGKEGNGKLLTMRQYARHHPCAK